MFAVCHLMYVDVFCIVCFVLGCCCCLLRGVALVVVRSSSFVARCLLWFVCGMSCGVGCVVRVSCLLFVAWWSVACCSLFSVCCVLVVG